MGVSHSFELNIFHRKPRLGKPATSSSLSRSDPKHAPERLFWKPLIAIAAAAFAVEIPFFFFGTPSGHDVEFHLYSWLEVLAQWKHGVVYPRWAGLAHFAYGEPRFVFYPPASWTLGTLLSAIFPWRIASPVYIWVVLVLAGLSMFTLVRRWLEFKDTNPRAAALASFATCRKSPSRLLRALHEDSRQVLFVADGHDRPQYGYHNRQGQPG